mgnify:FL=1
MVDYETSKPSGGGTGRRRRTVEARITIKNSQPIPRKTGEDGTVVRAGRERPDVRAGGVHDGLLLHGIRVARGASGRAGGDESDGSG